MAENSENLSDLVKKVAELTEFLQRLLPVPEIPILPLPCNLQPLANLETSKPPAIAVEQKESTRQVDAAAKFKDECEKVEYQGHLDFAAKFQDKCGKMESSGLVDAAEQFQHEHGKMKFPGLVDSAEEFRHEYEKMRSLAHADAADEFQFQYECEKMCLREHPCTGKKNEKCPPCDITMRAQYPCGHYALIPCPLYDDEKYRKCLETVPSPIRSKCWHYVEVPCYVAASIKRRRDVMKYCTFAGCGKK